MLNNISLMGRLARDPEIRYTQENTAVANFTLAVERDTRGEKSTDFIECVAWRGTAEFIEKYFHKGDMMSLTGRLQIRNWTDRDGNKRKASEIVVSNVYFCGAKKKENFEFTELIGDEEMPF